MALIHGMPMIGHCFLRSKMSRCLDDVYVATCDREIFDYVQAIHGQVVMTKDTHVMCTDRVVEATKTLEERSGVPYDIVVNIQGDQPMLVPGMIDAVVEPLLRDDSILCTTMMAPIESFDAHDDPNRVKIVVDQGNFALYMSREPIPSRRKWKPETPITPYVHVALIAFRRDFLIEFGELPMSPLEAVESIDYLRALENGYRIKMVLTDVETETVDTLEDLHRVEEMMWQDPFMYSYLTRRDGRVEDLVPPSVA